MPMPVPHPAFTLRPLAPTDNIDALTALLHRAYAPLGRAGMNYTAVDQGVEKTRARALSGHCWVAERDGTLVGTVTVNAGFDPTVETWARATPWFYRDDVAHLHQYAVDPAQQGSGIGQALMTACEDWARSHHQRAIALDTALPATHLRERYARAGYADVDEVQWDGKTYRSVVMVKPLFHGGVAPHAQELAHRAATIRTLWANFIVRDWAGARRLLRDDAQLHWPASGEHLLDADAFIRVNALYPEGWTLRVIEVAPLVDGRVLSRVEVRQDGQCFFAHSLWRFDGAMIIDCVETWASAEAPPARRSAETLGAYRRDLVYFLQACPS